MTSTKWLGFPKGPITAELAEREPYDQRLFSRPAPKPSPEVVRMLAQAAQRKQRRAA